MIELGVKNVEEIKWIGVALRPNTPELINVYEELREMARKMGVEVMLVKTPDVDFKEEKSFGEVCRLADVLISIGGDGTFLGLARRSINFQKPILGIHYGKLGFLAEVEAGDLKSCLKTLVKGGIEVRERMVLEATGIADKNAIAVNEFVIKSSKSLGIVSLKLYINNRYVNGYIGDGLIVATPTGSTAYNLSAGGPVLYPFSENIIFTPIASHSLTQRPLVLPAGKDKIEIRVEKGTAVMIADGQEEYKLKRGAIVGICKHEFGIKTVWKKDGDFFKVLKEKLNWGDHR